MAERPTDKANISFGIVKTQAQLAQTEAVKNKGSDFMYKASMAVALYELGNGLENLATGLRATYLLLDEVKRKLEQGR